MIKYNLKNRGQTIFMDNYIELKKLLEDIKNGSVEVDEGLNILKDLPFKDLGFAKPDCHRALRTGYPEVIYCPGKSIKEIKLIALELMKRNPNIMMTRASIEVYDAVKEIATDAYFHEIARIVVINRKNKPKSKKYIAILSAGTADREVAEEAYITADIMGNRVETIYDVGVAGVHRLFAYLDVIKKANVIIVVAGMDGALASVVGGLVQRPIIAVPTSVGYGANFGGIAPLLTMLNSCAAGVGVVNIDNGFGAGYLASLINSL